VSGPGVADQALRLNGEVVGKGRISGDMAAVPATTGVVTAWCGGRFPAVVTPGNSGADTCVGATVEPSTD
jgi:hypothetical protein